MNDFKTKHMNKLTELGVKLWVRLVEDTLTIINDKQNAEIILNLFIEQYHAIKNNTISMEKED